MPNSGDSIVRALSAPPSYVDSLRAAISGKLPATGGPAPREALGTARGSATQSGRAATQARTSVISRPSSRDGSPTSAQVIAPASIGSDTVRGIVKLTGTGENSRVSIARKASRSLVSLSGMGSEALRTVIGLDVVVRGVKITDEDFVIAGFAVREADGIPAWDGRLVQSASGYQLQLTDGGIKSLSSLPSGLRDAVGKRVWIAMKTGSTSPQSFGLVERR